MKSVNSCDRGTSLPVYFLAFSEKNQTIWAVY
jgi:hypothetical protein